MSKDATAWIGIIPIAMSLTLLLLILAGDAIFGANPLPVHDEDAVDHVGMLLLYAQLPLIGYFAFSRHRFKPRIPTLAVQLSLLALVFAAVYRADQANKELVIRRIQEDKPLSGSEMALGRFIKSQQQGKPDHRAMSPGVARFVARSPAMAGLNALGSLQSLIFKGVDRNGWDVYRANFTNERSEWRIFVDSNGKMFGLTFLGGQHGCESSEPYECKLMEPDHSPVAFGSRQGRSNGSLQAKGAMS